MIMKRTITTLILAITGLVSVHAQQNMTLYHMQTSPQRLYANPALRPDSKIFIGIPGLSSHQFNMAISRISLNDILDAVEPITSDSSVLNVTKLSDAFPKRNYLGIDYNADLVHFGFTVGKSMFWANASIRTSFKMSMPGDLLKFMLEGNGGPNLGKEFDFSYGLDAIQYVDLGIGYNRKFLKDDKLTVGGRLRYLQGVAVVQTERGNVTFKTDPNDFALMVRSDIRMNAASSVGPIDPSSDNPFGSFNVQNSGKNRGLGMDLGVSYELSKKIHLSAALNDLGYIKWTTNTVNYTSKFPNEFIEYDGVYYSDIFDTTKTFDDAIQRLSDTLQDKFNLDSTSDNFTTTLNPEFYLGGTFNVTKNHRAGVLFYGSFYQKKMYPGLTVSWNSKFGRVFGLSASYTMIYGSYSNIGLGMTLNAGPVQFYFVSDNIFGAISVRNTSVFNIRAGMNITLGRKNKDKKKEDPSEDSGS